MSDERFLLYENFYDDMEWGVSLNGFNPEPEDYIACASREDANKLIEFLQENARQRG